MNIMLRDFIAYKKSHLPNIETTTTLLAVSGGRDSVVMCDLFHTAGFPFAIAHVNFQLRGKASDSDAEFVSHLATHYGVKLHLVTYDTKAYAKSHQYSTQVAARTLRFAYFEQVCKSEHYAYYAAAHHQDDAVETYIINQLRGCGLSGLHGILPQQGRLLHPLLFTNRKGIDTYVKAKALTYVEDATNAQQDYMRNKVRLSLMPLLESIRPAVANTLWENSLRLQAVEKIYKEGLLVLKQQYMKETDTIDISALQLNPNAATLLYEWLSPLGFNYSQCEQMLFQTNQVSNAQHFYSLTHKAVLDRGNLLLQEVVDNVPSLNQRYTIKASVQRIETPFLLRIHHLSTPLNIEPEAHIALLDEAKIKFPLFLRRWESGDSFMPLGMNGRRKLLSDFFIDLKLSPQQKEKVWLLCSAGIIVWVVGYRISEYAKITSSTKKVLRLETQKTQVK